MKAIFLAMILALVVAAEPNRSGDILVGPKQGVSSSELEKSYSAEGKKLGVIKALGVHHVRVSDVDGAIARLKNDPRVAYVEQDWKREIQAVPNDSGYGSQWHLPKISAPQAWDITTGDRQITVAVIDTGVDGTHPDLAAEMVPGWNVLANSSDTSDAVGHGTAVSGVIGAVGNNLVGVSGVNWSVGIMPMRICDNPCSGVADSTVSNAIIWATDHGADVINMSIGGWNYSTTMQNAVNYAWSHGVVIVAAAGNNSSNTPVYPAAFDNVVAVGATDQNDALCSFSSFGSWVDVTAPGTYIYTTDAGGGYGNWLGTSFSSPNVAGLAALIFAVNPSLSNSQVVSLITNNVDDLGAVGFDDTYGWGRINAAKTLAAAQTAVPPPPPPSDTTPPTIVNSTISYNGKFITASATVTDAESGVKQVDLLVDGTVKATDTAAPYSLKINAKPIGRGVHTIVLRATDNAGNSSSTPGFTIMIN